MWIAGAWISKEIVYGIIAVVLLAVIFFVVIRLKSKKKNNNTFPIKNITKGKKLDRAEKEMPIHELPWNKGGKKGKNLELEDDFEDFDEEEEEDDGYTVVEKTINSKKPEIAIPNIKKKATVSSSSPKIIEMKEDKVPKKEKEKEIIIKAKEVSSESDKPKTANEDKMNFFTTNKSTL